MRSAADSAPALRQASARILVSNPYIEVGREASGRERIHIACTGDLLLAVIAVDKRRFGHSYGVSMEWVTGVVVPLVIGVLASVGTVVITRMIDARKDARARDHEAISAVRGYIHELDDYSDLLQAQADSHGPWRDHPGYDDTKNLIRKGSMEKIQAAFEAARAFFPRLRIDADERALIGNRFPDHGDHPVEGAINFDQRARGLEQVLTRGLNAP